eukprot:14978-Heterococcus_DN1.PRE.2
MMTVSYNSSAKCVFRLLKLVATTTAAAHTIVCSGSVTLLHASPLVLLLLLWVHHRMLAMRVGGGNAPAAGIKWDEKKGAGAVPGDLKWTVQATTPVQATRAWTPRAYRFKFKPEFAFDEGLVRAITLTNRIHQTTVTTYAYTVTQYSTQCNTAI